MSDYTIKNLMEIEDLAASRPEEVEARFARSHIGSRELGVSHFRYAPGFRSKIGHSHGQQEEVYVIVSGGGRVKLDDDVREIKSWDVVRVAPEVIRAFEAGADGLEFIAVGSSRPAEGDGVMVEDWWTE
jgi:mannose-6-phosphate isomerase-like protein (cupin superfamily)